MLYNVQLIWVKFSYVIKKNKKIDRRFKWNILKFEGLNETYQKL